ncbi:AEC family transporter [Pleomorphochaeta sp. DL1XJH-081]|uniref:AEC family transporter n=1 Tax=Pleomorphochaeta sp. DL1XJH-081 TaxID=3409690 RepID=UPI003BB4CC17
MFIQSFIQLLPILVLTLGGYLMDKIYPIDEKLLVKLISDFFMPLLIFHSLYFSDLQSSLIFNITGATTLVVALSTLVSYLYAKITRIDMRGFMPANIFMNSGFLGIPLMKLWGGVAAMNLIVIFDQVQTIYIFTLGILIITGGLSTKSIKTMLLSPILWSIFLGAFVLIFKIKLPQPILTTCEFGGSAAPPMAAFALGVSLSSTKVHVNRHVLAGIFIRIVGGFAFGYLGATLFGLEGLGKTVVIVASSLPAAVFTSVLPLRYGVHSEFAPSIVIVSTILGIFTIPLAFMFAV